jgi:hypothetical protein
MNYEHVLACAAWWLSVVADGGMQWLLMHSAQFFLVSCWHSKGSQFLGVCKVLHSWVGGRAPARPESKFVLQKSKPNRVVVVKPLAENVLHL